MGWNLGATDAPQSVDDDDRDRGGWFFQFNRTQGNIWVVTDHPSGGHVLGIGSMAASSDTDWLIENDPCYLLLGEDWRVPTMVEWENFVNAPVETGGLGGDFSPETAFESVLNLHEAGTIVFGPSAPFFAPERAYWSSTMHEFGSSYSLLLGDNITERPQNSALPIRCIEG